MKFSIIIPMYNVRDYIADTIESIVSQKYEDYELILVDDGSMDDTLSLAESIIKKYNKEESAKILKQSNNGASSARNLALQYSEGDYVVFVDSDDTLAPTSLCIFDEVVSNDKSDLYLFSYKVEDKDHSRIPMSPICDFNLFNENNLMLLSEYFQKTNYVITWHIWAKIFKASIIKQNHILFDPSLHSCNDFDFYFKYFQHVKSVKFTNKLVYNYRFGREGSITFTKISKRAFSSLAAFSKVFNVYNSMNGQKKEVLDLFSYLYLCSLDNYFLLNKDDRMRLRDEIDKNSIIYNYSTNKKARVKRLLYSLCGYKIGSYILFILKNKCKLSILTSCA